MAKIWTLADEGSGELVGFCSQFVCHYRLTALYPSPSSTASLTMAHHPSLTLFLTQACLGHYLFLFHFFPMVTDLYSVYGCCKC